jgi:hypothetical protein
MGWGASLSCPKSATVSDNYNSLNLGSSTLAAAALTALPSIWYPEGNKLTKSTKSLYNNTTPLTSLNLQTQAVDKNKLNLTTHFPSPSIPSSSSNHDKKGYTSCRYQQDKIDYFPGFGSGLLQSETVAPALGRQYHHPSPLSPYSASSILSSVHHDNPNIHSSSTGSISSGTSTSSSSSISSQQQPSILQQNSNSNNNISNSNITNSSIFNSHHFSTGNYHSHHDNSGRSCALPSPTIYPPTPPPSAPWIHPWFIGDTF